MPADLDPDDDLSFKHFASIVSSGGDRGHFYNEGSRSVVEQIWEHKKFTPNAIASILQTYHLDTSVMTDEQRGEAETFLKAHGFTAEQAAEFGRGVQGAESHLKRYSDSPPTDE